MRRRILTAALWALFSAGALAGEAREWTRLDEGKTGFRQEHFLFYSPALGKIVLIGGRTVGETKCVMAFDPRGKSWEVLSDARPPAQEGGRRPKPTVISSLNPGSIDTEGKRAYFLLGDRLLRFDVEKKKWSDLGQAAVLGTVLRSGRAMAHDPVNDELVVTGADLEPANVGWLAAVAYDIGGKKWRRLEHADQAAGKAHSERKAALEVLVELVGRTRHAWFRCARGEGTDEERRNLSDRLAALQRMPGLGALRSELSGVRKLIDRRKLLDALKGLRALRQRHERMTEENSPVPPARRDSVLCTDPVNEAMVLFGGSHDDYVTNDTWILDLKKRRWRRAGPELAPAPRAGHGLVYLPGKKKLALFDGYRLNNTKGYRAHQASFLPKRELWLYDVKADRWEPAASWSGKDASLPRRAGVRGTGFVGYSSNYCAMALAADGEDNLVFVGQGDEVFVPGRKGRKNYACATWMLPNAARPGPKAAPCGTTKPNRRDGRSGIYLASYCEEKAPTNLPELSELPANRWTVIPRPARYAFNAQRRCPYGTATWDPDTDQFLMWGGGHCSSSTSTVTHWSPVTGRMVISYDMDEPCGSNGGGPGGGTVMDRPWVGTHAYKTYAYDLKCRLMVVGATRLYDPVGMRWLKEKLKAPFSTHCYPMHVFGTPHGVVAWAPAGGYKGPRGLWLFDRERGWRELIAPGKAPSTAVDTSGGCYESRRDRLVMFAAPGYKKPVLDKLTAYRFKERRLETLTPANAELLKGKVGNLRESVYIPEADWIVLWTQVRPGEKERKGKRKERTGPTYNPVLDLANNRWLLVDFGAVPVEHRSSPAHAGVVYDARRKLVFAWSNEGPMAALRFDPETARVVQGEQ